MSSKKAIDISNVMVTGWEAALRGMRNSRNSWDKADSGWCGKSFSGDEAFAIGPNDMKLASKLAKAGGSHAKFRRMIHVSMDISAPLYWWKEFDTYKVGTTSNSTSTMYTITNKEFETIDFATDEFISSLSALTMTEILKSLNVLREKYLNEDDTSIKYMYWREIIQILPESYKQLRTIDFNYETLSRIVKERKGHKLKEWRMLINEIRKLPYANDLIFCDEHES